ncbi:ABC transporter ATP-binding protein [Jiella sp. MQZ9-1]|uniref:ABC transporter ATP-binding protein n=1 Tax=Jiella flava TaxID=2816857 RepID=A0A939FZ91_9HYPH|nr:ABC transporter ATP-binding protein [Jiella flava]MBO0662084.1 ABC transporter ATP-binding protein [Jiella flava]MCD2470588.1 ABC transporter ATP-binding protein [Jiella flava]
MTTLALNNVTKRYGKDTILDAVSLSIEDGETLAIFGPSGAGKTVLLRLIAGMTEPEAGEILMNGEDLIEVAPEHRSVGMAFQNFALFPHMSAFENIAAPLEAKPAKGDGIAVGVRKIAELLKIDHVLNHAPRALSNGQKQRTALARALVGAPKILLLDDPLRNVDAKLRFEMRLELPRLLEGFGSTVLYVTQDYREAMALGDRIAVLMDGRFAQVGTPEEIYLAPATIAVAELFGDPVINLFDAEVMAEDGHVTARVGRARLALPAGFKAAAGRPVVLGIRPESVVRSRAGSAGAINATVAALLPLNDRMVRLLITEDGQEFYTSRDFGEGSDAGEGATLTIGAAPEDIMLFDKESGHRIAPDAAAGRPIE